MGDTPTRRGTPAIVPLTAGIELLYPAEQTFEAMLDGWRNQQLARNLAFSTIAAREALVRRFHVATNEYPWSWTAAMVDEWFMDARAIRNVSASTMRSYQNALRAFCGYITDPHYGWVNACLDRFGDHPVQVCHDWNTATHVADSEARPTRRALRPAELQRLFDHADSDVAAVRANGRKGWLPAFRDATLLKVTYAYGLRRNEVRQLEVTDFGRNPKAPEFDDLGVLYVRHGKAMRGSAPKRRSVLTVFGWVTDVIDEWLNDVRPLLAGDGDSTLFPSERGGLMSDGQTAARMRRYTTELSMAKGTGLHSLRHSYVTHLIEAGWDARFVQEQVGHEHASTTSLYTSVSSDYRTRMLRASLDSTMNAIDNLEDTP